MIDAPLVSGLRKVLVHAISLSPPRQITQNLQQYDDISSTFNRPLFFLNGSIDR